LALEAFLVMRFRIYMINRNTPQWERRPLCLRTATPFAAAAACAENCGVVSAAQYRS
jgi:hypothetical protein